MNEVGDDARQSEKVVDQSVSHYRVEKLANGAVRVRSGGHVTTAETYYKALRLFAKHEQEHLEELADHLREDQWDSIYHDTINPEDPEGGGVSIETVLMTDEEGGEIQMFRATLGEREAYGRNRAQCLEELAWRLRKTEHEVVFHGA